MRTNKEFRQATAWVTKALFTVAVFGMLPLLAQINPSTTGLLVTPDHVVLQGGTNRAFTATSAGRQTRTVSWLVNGFLGGNDVVGRISVQGIYSAPPCSPLDSVRIEAVSTSDARVRGAAIVSLIAAPGDGRNYFVSPTGSDSNLGSRCRPWATISHADRLVRPGSVVHVAPGTYSAEIKTQQSGLPSARISYVSDTKWGAKLRYAGREANWTVNADYIDIIGFDISGTGRLGVLNFGSHNRIAGNYVHDLAEDGRCTGAGGAGINNANYAAEDNEIVDNVVGNIAVALIGACPTIHGIYVANADARVRNNLVYGAAGVCIQQWHAATRSQILNNTVFNCKIGILIGNGDAPGRVVSDYNIVANNIVYDNRAYGIIEFCNTKFNCTGTHSRYVNNLVFGNPKDIVLRNGLEPIGTIREDPLFLKYQRDGRGDYRLQPRSPAINAAARHVVPSEPNPPRCSSDIGAVQSDARVQQLRYEIKN